MYFIAKKQYHIQRKIKYNLHILYAQEVVLKVLLYSNLLYKIGKYFLERRYV